MKSKDYLEQGYLQGDVLCSIRYARMMCSNKDKSNNIVNRNMDKLAELCEDGNVLAKYEYILNKEYMDDISEEEVDWRFKEIIANHPIARFVYARRCFYRKDYEISFSIFNEPIFAKFPEAQYFLGLFYNKGYGDIVEMNIVKANFLFEQAFLGNYDCCLLYILTARHLDKQIKQETKDKIVNYAKRALQPYYDEENNSFSLQYCNGEFQLRWEVREKKHRYDEEIAYFCHLYLMADRNYIEAADMLCLAAALDNVDALLTIARLLTIKHKGIILGTIIDDITDEEGELKKAMYDFKYNIYGAEKIIERVEKLSLSNCQKEKMNSIKEKMKK